MSERCVFCSSTPVDVDMEDVWGTVKVTWALSRIDSLNLFAPRPFFEPGCGLWVCATCRPTFHEIMESFRNKELIMNKLAKLEVEIAGGVEALGRRVIAGIAAGNPVSQSDTGDFWAEFRRRVYHNYATGKLPNPSVHLVPIEALLAIDEEAADDLSGNQDSTMSAQEEEEIQGTGSSSSLQGEEKKDESVRKKQISGQISCPLFDDKVHASNLADDVDMDQPNLIKSDGGTTESGSDFISEGKRTKKAKKTDPKNMNAAQEPGTSKAAVKTARGRGRPKASRLPTTSVPRVETPAAEKDEADVAVNEQADDDTVVDQGENDEDYDEYDNLFVEKIENDGNKDSSVPVASDEDDHEEEDEDNGNDEDEEDAHRRLIEMSRMFAAKVASDPSKAWSVSVPFPETRAERAARTRAAARTEEKGAGSGEGTSAESGGDADTARGGTLSTSKRAKSSKLPSSWMYTTSFIQLGQLGKTVRGYEDDYDGE